MISSMAVYTASLVNLRLLIVIALILIGIDIEISVNMFNVSLSIGIWNIGLMSSSSMLLLVVLQVSYFVVVFSMTYIVNDSMCYSMYNSNIVNTLRRLNSITSVFICSMIALVESESVIVVLLSWDLLGVTSYLLVQYYNRSVRLNTAILTLMSSRVGDICLFIFIAQIVSSWGLGLVSGSSLICGGVGGIMCVVAITKRAQFPISSWLPIAIRAPTPVRSLVHSSTLVVAGVWLLVKFRVLLHHRIHVIPHHSGVIVAIGGIGLVTLFISSTIATRELDVKKIIALSTLRQVGFMFLISGLNLLSMSYFHLLSHAFYKSCIFIFIDIIWTSVLNRPILIIRQVMLVCRYHSVLLIKCVVLHLPGILHHQFELWVQYLY